MGFFSKLAFVAVAAGCASRSSSVPTTTLVRASPAPASTSPAWKRVEGAYYVISWDKTLTECTRVTRPFSVGTYTVHLEACRVGTDVVLVSRFETRKDDCDPADIECFTLGNFF
jgi:hypothetical protein